jgi:hypothetical protein
MVEADGRVQALSTRSSDTAVSRTRLSTPLAASLPGLVATSCEFIDFAGDKLSFTFVVELERIICSSACPLCTYEMRHGMLTSSLAPAALAEATRVRSGRRGGKRSSSAIALTTDHREMLRCWREN